MCLFLFLGDDPPPYPGIGPQAPVQPPPSYPGSNPQQNYGGSNPPNYGFSQPGYPQTSVPGYPPPSYPQQQQQPNNMYPQVPNGGNSYPFNPNYAQAGYQQQSTFPNQNTNTGGFAPPPSMYIKSNSKLNICICVMFDCLTLINYYYCIIQLFARVDM